MRRNDPDGPNTSQKRSHPLFCGSHGTLIVVKRQKMCRMGDCGNLARADADYCTPHLHPLALQQRIAELEATQPDVFRRIPALARIAAVLTELEGRAQPMKGASTEVTPRGRSHNVGDGIVAMSDHMLRPGYAVSSAKDWGLFGAVVSKVNRTAVEVEKLADPDYRPVPDERPRCGSSQCPQPNRRQPVGSKFCAYCGRQMSQ